ncbi:MAG: hypothetical protein HYR56_31440 [Acidobacteria bacterium]|nr:hypothetical protein [Acidobacteriota bacterium]MBI3427534.1 hypothetical protein [Acidobacteriota bacterium]
MPQSKFPIGWDEEKVRGVLDYYEAQTEDEAVAEDEVSFENPSPTLMEVPVELVSVIREMIAKRQATGSAFR